MDGTNSAMDPLEPHGDYLGYLPTRHTVTADGDFLTVAKAGRPLSVATQYLAQNAAAFGLAASDLEFTDFVATRNYTDSDSGISHITLQQTHDGVKVVNAYVTVNLMADGRVINASSSFLPGLAATPQPLILQPALNAVQALQSLGSQYDLTFTTTPAVTSALSDFLHTTTLDSGGLSAQPVSANLVYVSTAAGANLAWELNVNMLDAAHWQDGRAHWYDAYVDAASGTVLAVQDYVDYASYNVFPLPYENPTDASGVRTVVVDPQDSVGSPYGWHDTNGVAGPEYTDTRGNNVAAQVDRWGVGDESPTTRPSSGTLDFNDPLNLSLDPSQYSLASTDNLFYWTNIFHDVFYRYGFDEASGNFQLNNYGNGGLANDRVIASVQFESNIAPLDNAFMSTPPDGVQPGMMMGEFDLTTPNRDSALEVTIPVHEFMHGVSNRLIGNASGLWANQSGSLGEGWSDFASLWLTQKATDAKNDAYPVGNYVLGYPNNGPGIRRYPYSFDMTIDPLTLGDYNGGYPNNEVHNAGELWTSVLWDINWLLIDRYGYSSNLYSGAGGNNLAMQLVIEGMKLTPINPTFIDARDAILAADIALTGGENQYDLWTAFARRGWGVGASTANADSDIVIESFKMPPISPPGVVAGPSLFAVRPNDGDLLTRDATTVLDVAPREMRLLFKGGSNLDAATLDGIRITRTGADQEFDVASTRSDLGTGGRVLVEFTANQLWEEQNGIAVVLTESDHLDDSGPAISVVGNRIFVDMNRHAGAETTAGELVRAINLDPVAGSMITARIDGGTEAAPEDVRVTDYVLDPASVTTDLNTSTGIRFTARQSGTAGNLISVELTCTDHLDDSGPTITVSGKVIRIDLNSNLGHETTAQQLVDALQANPFVRDLVVVELLPLDTVDVTVGDPLTYSPIALAGGGVATAQVTTNFGTADAVFVQFLAVAPGAAGNGTTITVKRSDHGDASGPTVDVPAAGQITIDLNTRVGAQTTAEQLVAAVNAHLGASALVTAQVVSAAGTELTGLTMADPATYSPLTVGGGGVGKATATSDLGTGGAVQLRFTADTAGAAGNDIRIVVTEEDYGAAGGPDVAVDETTSPPLKLITVKLNTNLGNETKAGDVVAAINAHAQARLLVDAEIISAAETVVANPADYPLNLALADGGNEFDPMELSGANAAQASTDFNAANPLEVRFTAVARGAAGNGVVITFRAEDRGATGLPVVDRVIGSTIEVLLNNNAAALSTVAQVIAAINGDTAAAALLRASQLYGDPDEPIGDRVAGELTLTLGGADDQIIVPGYKDFLYGNTNEVVIRFATTLPDDLYRIEVFGFDDATYGITGVRDTAGNLFLPFDRNDDRDVLDFELELGAQIIAVVPQPVSRDVFQLEATGAFNLTFDGVTTAAPIPLASTAAAVQAALESLPGLLPGDVRVTGPAGGPWGLAFGGRYYGHDLPAFSADAAATLTPSEEVDLDLAQAEDQILVYFNDDNLYGRAVTTGELAVNPTAVDPSFYQLILTQDTVRNTDDLVFLPQSITYDPETDMAVLTFSSPLTDLVDPNTGAAIGPGTFRLRVGTNETVPLTPRTLTLADAPSDFDHAVNLSATLDTGPVIEVVSDGAGAVVGLSILDGQTFTITDTNDKLKVFEFNDPSIGSATVAAGHQQVTFESGDNPPATTPANLAAAILGAINQAILAGELTMTAAINGPRVNLTGEKTVVVDTGVRAMHVGTEALVISQSIKNNGSTDPAYTLDLPGSQTEPSQREIQDEQHFPGNEASSGVSTLYYHFNKTFPYDVDPDGNPLYNDITPEQMDLARAIFDYYSHLLGIQFVETESTGNWIKTGQFGMQVISQFNEPSRPGGIAGVGGPGGLIMDIAENWTNTLNGSWFSTAFHEITHMIGLVPGHCYELPPGTTMGSTGYLAIGQAQEPVWPGLQDLVHTSMIYRPESKDIDMYEFQVPAGMSGTLTVETIAERMANASSLDTLVQLYRENADGTRELLAQNDDYFSLDSYLELDLGAGTYYLGVSASDNDEYDPTIADSGFGGHTEGSYQLKINFRPAVETSIVDTAGTALDGDGDGLAGGVYDFWFETAYPAGTGPAAEPQTLFVDKGNVTPVNMPDGSGTLADPYKNIPAALAAARPGDIVRMVGNGGLDDLLDTPGDNYAYEIGRGGPSDEILSDGEQLNVPQDVTLMIDAGALLKLRGARIGVGSSPSSIDRSKAALQVLGTPGQSVIFTSYHDQSLGVDTNPLQTTPVRGDWGGIEFRHDVDTSNGRLSAERQGIFLDYVNHAQIQYGGGQVLVDSELRVINAIHIIDARPTVSFNRLTQNADSAISATPDSFEETNFNTAPYQLVGTFSADYVRIGPEFAGNWIAGNSTNAVTLNINSGVGGQPRPMTVAGRFDDTDLVYVIAENLDLLGTPSGAFQHTTQPQMSAVTFNKSTTAGTLPAGTYRYRLVFTDAAGYEGAASAASAAVTLTGTGQITLNYLPPATTPFTGRRLYRSKDGGTTYTLVAELDKSTASYVDAGPAMGGTFPSASLLTKIDRPRTDGRLVVDPGAVVKLQAAKIEAGFGSYLIAEGTGGYEVVFTSRTDDRYGFGGTFDTNDDDKFATDGNPATTEATPAPANWAGLYIGPGGSLSLDQALVTFAGGVTTVGGGFAPFNAVELHQTKRARIANTTLQQNADGVTGRQSDTNRDGHFPNATATIFVRGAHPVIVNNIIRDNTNATGSSAIPAININVNALSYETLLDYGRARGTAERFSQIVENTGPLVRLNKLDGSQVNGMQIRSEMLHTEVIWDDTDIVHVVNNAQIFVPDYHTYGGLLLKSNPTESLVVKLTGNSGFVSTGRPLDIDDRIGGILQVVGQPGFPVVMTSLSDDTIGAGFTPSGAASKDTNGNGTSTGTAGDWNGILIDQYSHDRNVELITERESPSLAPPGDNGTASKAQFIGELAANEKAGDDALRLGFVIEGLINVPADVDVYSFKASAGTQIWLDIDRTTIALDTVVELIDANGIVLARSDNSGAETANPALLYNGGLAENHVNPLQALLEDYEPTNVSGTPKDNWTTNKRDAGMRVVLPGAAGTRNIYHVRVRSSSANLNNVAGGLTAGKYELQLRLRETDELAGCTVRYADIRYADTGVEVRGMPIHSPLTGEASEPETDNNGPAAAGSVSDLGNVLNSDRAAISIAGAASAATDVDFYRFSVASDAVQGTVTPPHMAVTIDLDYADGLGRPDYSLYVFDSTGKLILAGYDSNVAEDQPGANQGLDMDDLTRGSAGVLDPYLGTVQLPSGTSSVPEAYNLAVSTASQIPAQLNQFQVPNPANPLTRMEPINSVERIAEDRIYTGGGSQVVGAADLPLLMADSATYNVVESAVPYHLGDIVLYVSQERGYDTNMRSTLNTVNPFTGFQESRNGDFGQAHGDIAMRPDGELFTFSFTDTGGNGNAGATGNLLFLDGGTGQPTSVGDDGLNAFWWTGGPPPTVQATGNARFEYEAMMFTGYQDSNLWAIGNRRGDTSGGQLTSNILYQFNAVTGAVDGYGNNRTGDARASGAGTEQVEIGQVTSGGAPLATTVTGMAQVGTTTYIVDNSGMLYQLSLVTAAATVPIDLKTKFPAADPPDALAALTKVPTTVDNGLYANVLIAIEQDGTMFAFFARNTNNWGGDPAADFLAGDPAPIFVDGQSVVDTGITQVTGLAFSTVQSNLWHMTTDRDTDPGHGIAGIPGATSIDPVFDDSRVNRYGSYSLFFGIEDTVTDVTTNNLLYRDRTQTGGQRAPGGAHGTLISQPFSLKGYSPEDRPTLYFNYYLDTEKENSSLSDGQDLMEDSFRVYAAGEDGIWQLLATNNRTRDPGLADDEFEYGYYVQPLFDIGESSAPNSWRQARITLSPLAGQENVRLRFEFSTAGGENVGHAQTTGDELFTLAGNKLRDGQTFAITDSTGTPITFEFDLGYTLVTPTGADLGDTDQFVVTDGGDTQTFTFVDTITGFYPNEILIAGTDSADDVATKVQTVLGTALPGMAIYRDGNRLNIPTATWAAVAGLPATFLEGAPGVAATAVEVDIHAGMPAYDEVNNRNNRIADNDVRAQIVQAMARTFNVVGQETNYNSIKTSNDLIHVIGHSVTDSQALGWTRQDATTTGLIGDQFGLSYDATVPVSRHITRMYDDANYPDWSAARQGMNNAIQGVYIDDIIIGFAERGEMVTGAVSDATGFVANDAVYQPSSATPRGSYQVEIRRSASYLDMEAFSDPWQPFHSRSFDTNDRLAQQVTLVAPAGYEIADGQTFVISDGVDTLTFEYDDLGLRDRINVEDKYDDLAMETEGISLFDITFGGTTYDVLSVDIPYPMPSPTIALGMSSKLTAANTAITLYAKDDDTQLARLDLDTFFGSVHAGYNPGALQPSAIYDTYADRFVVIAPDSDLFGDILNSNLILGAPSLLIAVSKTGAPADLTAASWDFYSIATTHDFGDGPAGIYYPKLAVDADSLYITGNYLLLDNTNDPQGTLVTRLDKTTMTRACLDVEVMALGLFPVQSVGRDPSDPQLFLDFIPNAGIRVWEMDDGNTLSYAQGLMATYGMAPSDAPQGGSAATLQTLTSIITSAVWRRGKKKN